ncbi:MAG: hypothetical protein LJF15_16765 [Acidobacteria bacterium]|jgi:chromosome segregation ATPase|nr:hypothetical protein [Acidobacteriota bacterium]
MSDPREETTQPPESPGLLLEVVAHAAAELAAERELDALIARFLDRLREWASPSAVLAAVRDPSSESGWRLLPALSFGSGPLGAERSLPRLVESAPGCLERPTVVHPDEDVPGVHPRDNCIVPWVHEGESGILVLRGLPRPFPPNLGEAVTVLAAPVWPRLLGGPAHRLEWTLAELRRVAERLGEDAGQQLERLRASGLPGTGDSSGEAGAEGVQVADLMQQVESTRKETELAKSEQDMLRESLQSLEAALKESEAERDRARDEVDKLETRAGLLHTEHEGVLKDLENRCRKAEAAARMAEEVRAASQRELEEARSEAEHSTLEWDELRGRVAVLQEALQDAEGERDRVRDEAERLSARVESMQSEHSAAVSQVEERRKTAETALRKALEDLTEAQREAKSGREAKQQLAAGEDGQQVRISALEAELKDVQAERDRARSEVERLEEQNRAAETAVKMAEEERTQAQRETESVRESAERSTADADEQKRRMAELETAAKKIEADRDRVRAELERLEERHRKAEAAATKAGEERDAAKRELEEALERVEQKEKRLADAQGGAAGGAFQDGEKAIETLRSSLAILRRTPFMPPGLRDSMAEGEALVAGKDDTEERWLRVVLLDRDAASLEPLADELEKAGVDVKIANYPEELALLMKTPEAQKLDAIVCDILAFRPDQTVAGLFRGWAKDRPGLSFFLTFSSDDPAETERANRVPLSLTAARLRRPMPVAELLEKLKVLAERQSASDS